MVSVVTVVEGLVIAGDGGAGGVCKWGASKHSEVIAETAEEKTNTGGGEMKVHTAAVGRTEVLGHWLLGLFYLK